LQKGIDIISYFKGGSVPDSLLSFLIQYRLHMNIKELFLKTRTCRRFDETYRIELDTLEYLVDLARLSPSGGNRQPLKFLLFNKPEECERIFPFLAWAGYLKDWAGPEKGERPSAYIVILGDKSVADNFGVDHGIAAHSIMLGAAHEGLGGCIIASVSREELCNDLKIPDKYEILIILALGKPVEDVIIEEIKDNDVKYWRDDKGIHHVPKRNLRDLIIKL
jgi:nitroreductase